MAKPFTTRTQIEWLNLLLLERKLNDQFPNKIWDAPGAFEYSYFGIPTPGAFATNNFQLWNEPMVLSHVDGESWLYENSHVKNNILKIDRVWANEELTAKEKSQLGGT